MRIAHLTSVHGRHDVRIFLKECRSLARHGHDVTVVVADGPGGEVRDGVRIVDVGRSSGRMARMLGAARRTTAAARTLDADVYHLHDPELIPWGLALKRAGKLVVFDAHEDLPKQVLGKHYLHPWLRGFTAWGVSRFERLACPRLDAIVAATPAIRDKFAAIHPRVVAVNNYPLPDELAPASSNTTRPRNQVCYVGGMTRERGILELVEAMSLVTCGARLVLAGTFAEAGIAAASRSSPGWPHVAELGHVSRDRVRDVMAQSLAGLVPFLPAPNHVESQPNKLFEYMSAGLPVIASDFPAWRAIIDGYRCGLCVDPSSPAAIARAIDELALRPAEAAAMGQRGRAAVEKRFRWDHEERTLLALYSELDEIRRGSA